MNYFELTASEKLCNLEYGINIPQRNSKRRNKNGITYAAYRSLDSNRYMGDCTGSTKEYSFRLGHNTTDNELHLFECAIDALSYATLLNMYGHNWQSYNLVSLAGVYQPKEQIEESTVPIALAKYLKENPNIDTVMLHLDNDYVGRMATKALKIILPKHIKVIDSPPTLGKDVNDFLRIKKGLIKPFKYNWRNDKNAKKQSLCTAR